MKRSVFALAALALSAACAAASFVCEHAVAAYRYTEASIKAAVFGPTVQAPDVADQEPASKPVVALRRAGSFVLRLLKREQPIITPTWRLVPST